MIRVSTGTRPHRRTDAALVLAAMALAACSRGGSDWRSADTTAPQSAEESGYLKPPAVLAASRSPDGAVVVAGRSTPSVRMRLSGPPPTGAAYGATANDKGDWSVTAPPSPEVRLFGVAEELAGRDVQGEGYVALLPAPGPAGALLRAGGGASVLAKAGGLKIAAMDFDSSGAAVISGLGRAGASARAVIDGTAAGEARINEHGRFSISLAAPLRPGEHEARVEAGDQVASTKFTVEPPRAVSGLPYRGERTPQGWRVDWLTPGGGEQTTLIFDAAES